MGSTPGSVARRSLKLTLKGKEYIAFEPDINELAMFESHIKSQRLETFLSASGSMTPADRQGAISAILKESISSDEIQAELTSLDGVRYMSYLILKGNPGVTLDTMGDIIDLSNIGDVIAVLDSLGADEDEVDPQTAAQTGSP